jgi:S1/P1 Nuclease
MRSLASAVALVCALVCVLTGDVLAWGQEGHSIIAEIAQQRLSPPAAQMVATLLKGRSLASIASWADDVRDSRPETTQWHFVDIPLDVPTYKPARDCKPNTEKGDCIIAELERLENDLRCTTGEAQTEALKFAVHFVGDIHQPLHTVAEKTGGNDLPVDVFMRGLATGPNTPVAHAPNNLHVVWDSILIQKTVWAWGAYVDRLEAGWLISSEAQPEDPAKNPTLPDADALRKWAEEAHQAAHTVWYLRPADDVIDDRYLRDVLPKLDRQLGVAGLRLARFLNAAFGSACPTR